MDSTPDQREMTYARLRRRARRARARTSCGSPEKSSDRDSSLRPAQVSAPRRSDDVSMIKHRNATQEGGLDPASELDPLERRIALHGFGVGGANDEALMRVDERDVGIVTGGDIALAEQAEPLRRLEAQKLGHVLVGHAALAAFAQHAGEQILGAAKSRFRQPDIGRILFRPFLFGGTAGVVAHDPVDLTLQDRLP